MTSRTLRVLLLLTAFGAVVAGTLVVFGAERNLTLATAANAGFDAQARAVVDEIGRLRGAQQAYVAAGQGTAYWMTQAAEHLATVDRGIVELANASSSEATRSAVQAAAASLEQFRSLDKRARQYVQNNQSLMASDVIFTESLGALTTAAEHVGAAAENERTIRAAESGGLRARQLYAAAGAAGLLLLVVLLLVPVPESDVDVLTAMRALTESAPLRPQAVATPVKPKAEVIVDDEDSSARLIARAVGRVTAAAGRDDSGGQPLGSVSGVRGPGARDGRWRRERITRQSSRDPRCARRDRVGRRQAGRLALPDVHARLSQPRCWYGWAPSRPTPTTPRRRRGDRANWWRWRASADSPGALVTPIITADGCVGVLAAELPNGRERREDVRALATIFSAQLATVVTPVAEVSQAGLVDRVAT